MSHFFTLVLAESATENPAAYTERILAPYSENLEVAPYQTDCYCVGRIAQNDAFNAAGGKEKLSYFRDEYAKLPAENRPEWKDFIKEFLDAEDTALKAHPLYNKPDITCDECNGTGKRETTYNPQSKWDWFEIGGRWTGQLSGYKPEEDPENKEVCMHCSGTGTRNDEYVQGQCNGCGGTGKAVKWPTSWKKHDGDVQPVLNLLSNWKDDFCPYAIVTPDGKWLEKGKMGWWGMSFNESDTWEQDVQNILKQYGHCMAIVVDCHI